MKCQKNTTSAEDCIVPTCMVDPCSTDLPKVVIVGAGMAGLSAAQRLAACGITDFTVLEATDRYLLLYYIMLYILYYFIILCLEPMPIK